MKNRARVAILILTFLMGIILFFPRNPIPVVDSDKIKTSALIEYPGKFNYRQTINDCGPFNTAAVVRTLKNQEVDSRLFAEEVQWRLPNKYTLPWGIEKQLEENGIEIAIPDLESLSDAEKILFLYEQISMGRPVIILGGKENFQHYITLFGFDLAKNEFYVYDSLGDKNHDIEGLTIDENPDFPGNKTLSSESILDFWGHGGMYGLYNWYALVAVP